MNLLRSFVQAAAMSSTSKPVLKIDWATHEAAKFACEKWHYSKCMPAGKLVKLGVWESGKFIGVVLFSRGANAKIGINYHLNQTEACELTRIAMTKHITPVSRVVSIAMKFLQKNSPGLRLIVSYADEAQGHHGGVYQAGGWVYVGASLINVMLVDGEKKFHSRNISNFGGTKKARGNGLNISWLYNQPKHKYLMPLDDDMRKQIMPLAKPYPKRTTRTKEQDAEHPSALGGASPTRALHIESLA